MDREEKNYLHINTPLLESRKLGNYVGAKVLLKMDALQPSGSFKIRGIGYCCSKAVKENHCTKFITSSGGNAGLAVAYAGRKLNVPVTVVVPETTPDFMRQLIEAEGAEVKIYGKVWDSAHEHAMSLCIDPNYKYIHPFDDKDIWKGHSTLIEEVFAYNIKPSVIITVVGGGGLLVGIIEGLHKVGWNDIPIIACETEGAASFAASVQKDQLVTLDGITTIARSLGAKTICKEVFEWTKKHPIISHIVTDKMSVDALSNFVDDHRILVEPACGAGLAAVYSKAPALLEILKKEKEPVILVVVCGGNMVSLEKLKEWKEMF